MEPNKPTDATPILRVEIPAAKLDAIGRALAGPDPQDDDGSHAEAQADWDLIVRERGPRTTSYGDADS